LNFGGSVTVVSPTR